MSARKFDVVVLGATGFTGRLVAAALVATARPGRIAIAGRSPDRLAEVAARLGGVGTIIADLDDFATLTAMAAQGAVVATTAGPYGERGGAVVAACLAAGAHYCDLTGEVPWMRRMIDAHHETATAARLRVVHACGFDSIPSDLGVLALQRRAIAALGRPCDRVTTYVGELRGGVSGGTAASMLLLAEQAARDPSVRRLLADPYALVPDAAGRGDDRGEQRGLGFSPVLDRVTAPFVMAQVNARVVRRSSALLGGLYGRGFRYDECASLPRSPRGALMAGAMALGPRLLEAAIAVAPLRRVLAARLPQPGEGPSATERERGRFTFRLVGEIDGRPRVFARVADHRDPGYGSTAVMMSQAALSLATDALVSPGGVLTPAVALGERLVERLRAAGMTFEAGLDRSLVD